MPVPLTKSCVGGGREFSRESRKRDFANWRVLIAILTVNCIGLALIAKPTEEYRLQNIAAGKASGPPPIPIIFKSTRVVAYSIDGPIL